jgi:integrase
MTCWTAGQLAAFLGWAREHSQHYALWHLLANTGERRGETLAHRWRDFGADGSLRIRWSAGMVRVVGQRARGRRGRHEVGQAADGQPRRRHGGRAARPPPRARRPCALLARDDAPIFGDVEGAHRNPEHVSRQFVGDLARCRKAIGADHLPVIRLHDLRHTHASIPLTAREPVHVVSQRLGHANPNVTLSVYAHVMPGSQKEAANLFARPIGGAASGD